MTTYARIVNGKAVDVTIADPSTIYHADVASQFVEVPDGTQNHASYDGQQWTPPPPEPAPPTVYPILAPEDFYLAFKVDERTMIKSSDNPQIAEFWATYQMCERTSKSINPNLPSVQTALSYMREQGILKSDDRIASISNGIPQ